MIMRLPLFLMAVVLLATLVTSAFGQYIVPDSSGYDRNGTFVDFEPATLVDDGSGPFGTNYYLFTGQRASAGVPDDWGLTGSYSMSLWFLGYDAHALNNCDILAGSYADGVCLSDDRGEKVSRKS